MNLSHVPSPTLRRRGRQGLAAFVDLVARQSNYGAHRSMSGYPQTLPNRADRRRAARQRRRDG